MQIKRSKNIFIAVILLAAVFFVWNKIKHGKDTKETVKEFQVSYGSIQKSISATGTVQPQNRLALKPPIGGRIDKVLVVEGQSVKTGDILVLMSSTDRAALLDAAKPQGEKAISYWADVYKPTPIIAPIDGEVIVRAAQPGQTVTPTDDVIVLSDRLIVQAQVDETDIGKVKEGQKVVISLDAYPEIEENAVVEHIYYESKLVNNVTIYNVDIVPEKVPDVFRSGMSANVRIIQESKDHILLVPVEAVKRLPAGQAGGKDGSFAFVRHGKNKKPQKQKVELGISDEANVEVVSGLGENDTVVVKTQKPRSAAKGPQAAKNPFVPSFGGGGGRR